MTAHSKRTHAVYRNLGTKRTKLMLSCAAAAIAVSVSAPREARAQAFQGTIGSTVGTANRAITSPTTETITVGTQTATINWTPNDNDGSGTIDFLPSGNVATFTNDPRAITDFTVLNRIVPSDTSRPIALNGTVISQLQDLSNNTTSGGHVWFYSPGGIIVGATAVFDVGGLLLTTNDPLSFDQTANGFTGNFVASSNSTSSVQIDPGAKITASPENSYVALVAPRVVQNGEVNVNGSAAYVAGEDVTLTMNQGLFDIAVNVGTSDPNDPINGSGIIHGGTTGGPASSGAGDNHRIYMVAVPKNQALTMLLAGNVGFTPASSASLNNGQIVLAAGSSVAETTGTLVVTSPADKDADLTIGPGNYTSDVRAFARGDIYASADTGDISFARDVSLTSLLAGSTGQVTVGATNAFKFSVGRNLTMQTTGATFSSGAPEEANVIADGGTVSIGGNLTINAGAAIDGTPGDVDISVSDASENHGSLTVGGVTLVNTSASASPVNPDVDSADAFAGDITIEAFDGGSISLGNTQLFATANGQDNSGNGSSFNQGLAGDAFGGDISISSSNADITINGNLFATTDAFGGNMLDGGLFGGNGFGGSVDVSIFDGTIQVTGTTFLSALGVGGSFTGIGSPATAAGGIGFGGFVHVSSGGSGFSPPGSIALDGNVTLRADGTGGNGQSGGSGIGGSAGISGTHGTITLGPTISVSAHGTGGNASFGFGGNGGTGSGGDAFINALAVQPGVEQFAAASTIIGGDATIDVSGTGGTGGAGNGDNIAAGAGGDGFGGAPCPSECTSGGASAYAQVDGASLTLGNVTLNANGTGGAGGAGGNDQQGGAGGQGSGGSVQVGLFDNFFNSSGAADGEAHYGNILGLASGNGGAGGAGGSSINGPMPNGDGGVGEGGVASLWSNSLVTASSLTFFANGNGGNGANGGSAFGGLATITSNDAFIFINDVLTRIDGLVDIDGAVTIEAAAATGNGSTGGTGDAQGGTAQFLAQGGDITIGGDAGVWAGGDAEDGVTAGGQGAGGTANVEANDGANINAGSLLVQANGEGGNASGGQGGTGAGGFAQVLANAGSSITVGDLTVGASGVGGNGISGGAGLGSFAQASAQDLDAVLTVNGVATIVANGTGGNGTIAGTGGDGFGGTANLFAGVGEASTDGGTVVVADAVIRSQGQGGDAGLGGAGQGGVAQVGSRYGTFTVTNTLFGDAGAAGGDSSAGTGGTGTGGTFRVTANFVDDTGLSTTNLGQADLWAVGIGGNGVGSGNAGGTGNGGLVQLSTPTAGSTMTATALTLHAGANGGVGGSGAIGGDGGDAFGGHALIDISAGNANLGDVQSFARGVAGNGGSGSSGAGGDGGDGTAGTVELNVAGTLTGTSYQAHAQANGGAGGAGTVAGAGGSAQGGSALFNVLAGGDASFTGAVTLDASAFGGLGGGSGASGGDAFGGDAHLSTQAADSSLSAGALNVFAEAGGGDGGSGATGGRGGDGTGGRAWIEFADGTVDVGAMQSFARGFGGDGGTGSSGAGGDGGSGFGGTAEMDVGGILTGASFLEYARAFGGAGGTGTTRGLGGLAQAGQASLDIFSGAEATFTDTVAVNASAFGGTGSIGGDAFGNFASTSISGTLTAPKLENTSQGFGGVGTAGAGGEGRGGTSSLDINGGTLAISGLIFQGNQGVGGNGTTAGGDGFGGSSQVFANNGTATFGAGMELDADGQGGTATAGPAGDSAGGFAEIFAFTSDLTGGDMSLTATGAAGGQADISLNGSSLTANSLTLDVSGGASAGQILVIAQSDFSGTGSSIDTGSFSASANGGTAGDIFLTLADGSTAALGTAQFNANGSSGGNVTFDIGGPTILGEFAAFEGIGALAIDAPLTADSMDVATTGDFNITSVGGKSIDVTGTFSAQVGGAMNFDDNDEGATIHADTIDWVANSFTNNFDITGRVIGISTDLDLDVTGTVIIADETLALTSLADVLAGDLSAGLLIDLNAGNDITTGILDSGGDILADALGNIQTANLTAAGSVDLDANGNIGFGDANVGNLDFSADGTVTGGNILANSKVTGDAAGAVLLGDITVGPGLPPADDFSVGISSATSITVGDVSGVDRVGFATLGDLVTGDVTAGPLFMTLVGGNVTTGSITTAPTGEVYMGDVSMFIANGGPDNFDAAPVLAAAPVATGGSITIGGPVTTGSFRAAAGVDFDPPSITTTQSIEISAGNDINVADLTAGTFITLDAGNDIFAGTVTGPSVTATAGNSLLIATLNASQIADLTSGTDLNLDGYTGGSLSASSGNNLTIGPVNATGAVDLSAINDILADGNISGSAVTANAGHDILAANISGQTVNVHANNALSTGDVTASQTVDLSAGTNIATNDIDAGQTVTVDSGGGFSVFDVNAGTSATFTAAGLAQFFGTVSAPTITVTSADIDIFGFLGVFGVTDLVTLNAISDGAPILLGGSGQVVAAAPAALQYHLDDDELIRSDAIVFNAFGFDGGPTPDVIAADLQMEGTQTPGGGAHTITLNTDGRVLVNGVVAFTGAGATDELTINAANVQVNTSASGLLAVANVTEDAPAGLLTINADNIWVGSQTLLDSLNGDVNFAGRDDQIGTNPGDIVPVGYLIAGGMSLNVGQTLFVQNSGSSTDFAGITVGDGGLTVRTTGQGPAEVVAYGRRFTGPDTFITGNDFFNEVDFGLDAGSAYAELAEFNECLINSGCSGGGGGGGDDFGGIIDLLGPESILGPVDQMGDPEETTDLALGNDEQGEEGQEGEDEGSGQEDANSQLIGLGGLTADELIDEGVTSGGDNNQWSDEDEKKEPKE